MRHRWVSVRVNVAGAALTTFLAFYLTYVSPIGASNTGFSLSMAREYMRICVEDALKTFMAS